MKSKTLPAYKTSG